MSKTRFAAAAFALILCASAAQATVIGVAVDGIGSSTTVGSTNGDGSINFFAPLSAGSSGTYGVDAGTSSDICNVPNTCGGGTLDMFLRFDPVSTGQNILTLFFRDLDLIGANDPWFFFESLTLANAAGDTLFDIDSVTDGSSDLVILASHEVQFLGMFIDSLSSPLFLQLTFATSFSDNTPNGWYRNTAETMLATMSPVSVPEPATLSLLGAGLVIVGFAGRRKAARAA